MICAKEAGKKGDPIPSKINLLTIEDSLVLMPAGTRTDKYKGNSTEIKCQRDCNEDRQYRCRHVIREKNGKKGFPSNYARKFGRYCNFKTFRYFPGALVSPLLE